MARTVRSLLISASLFSSCRQQRLGLAIDVAPVPDLQDDDHQFSARHAVQNPVVADANSEDILVPGELARAGLSSLSRAHVTGSRGLPKGVLCRESKW
jgi:hypothetical protein